MYAVLLLNDSSRLQHPLAWRTLHCTERSLCAGLCNVCQTANCHPAIKLLVQEQPHGAISVPQSRTVLGQRRPYVIGATTFNRWSAYYSDSEESLIPVAIGPGTRSWKWSGHRALWKSTRSTVYSAKHNCQQRMVVNAVQLLLYWKKKTTTKRRSLWINSVTIKRCVLAEHKPCMLPSFLET